MGRTSNIARQARCERCILAHRPCDGKFPICSTCATVRRGPMTCIYPEDMPSRSELKARKKQEAMEQKAVMGKEEQNEKQEAGGLHNVDRAPGFDDGPAGLEQRGRKRKRFDEEVKLIQEEDIISLEPSSDPPSDSPASPLENNRVETKPTLENIGYNLAQNLIEAFDRDLPKHQSGILKGLADYRGLEVPDVKLSKEEQDFQREAMEGLGNRLFAMFREKEARAPERSMNGKK